MLLFFFYPGANIVFAEPVSLHSLSFSLIFIYTCTPLCFSCDLCFCLAVATVEHSCVLFFFLYYFTAHPYLCAFLLTFSFRCCYLLSLCFAFVGLRSLPIVCKLQKFSYRYSHITSPEKKKKREGTIVGISYVDVFKFNPSNPTFFP